MNAYEHLLMAINTANLSANLENVKLNEEIAARSRAHENDGDEIIGLLVEILEVLKHGRK